MKKISVIGAAAISLFLFASMASAHVTVQPKQTTQGSYEVFSVRVPSESENVTTTGVKVTVPDGVAISRVEPKAGWKYDLELAPDTKAVKSITWTAEGAGLAQTEFTDFRISGKVADDAAQLVWKAYQTYSDKSVVEWVGADGSDHPASVTAVVAGAAEGDGHGAPAASADAEAAADKSGAKENASFVLSIAAAVLGAAALIASLTRRKRA
ncbi:YcnI family protein [Paenibacillus sp. MWE-103]|uniref:YcnI family protein n=2 Tax=Paenibacillus artemisiicola TaxID=1172618 RepID=A0ABS3W8P0_9BACL|nr:YcnI family protein [Paenibacillus artemisiicola]